MSTWSICPLRLRLAATMARVSARSRAGQVEHGALFQRAAENVVERLLLLEHGDEKLDRGAARRQPDLKVAHMRPVPRLFVGV